MFLDVVDCVFVLIVEKVESNQNYYYLRNVDYEQSLFPLRDSRGKRTSQRARKSPVALKRAPVSTR